MSHEINIRLLEGYRSNGVTLGPQGNPVTVGAGRRASRSATRYANEVLNKPTQKPGANPESDCYFCPEGLTVQRSHDKYQAATNNFNAPFYAKYPYELTPTGMQVVGSEHILDTPGVHTESFWDIEPDQLVAYFKEIAERGDNLPEDLLYIYYLRSQYNLAKSVPHAHGHGWVVDLNYLKSYEYQLADNLGVTSLGYDSLANFDNLEANRRRFSGIGAPAVKSTVSLESLTGRVADIYDVATVDPSDQNQIFDMHGVRGQLIMTATDNRGIDDLNLSQTKELQDYFLTFYKQVIDSSPDVFPQELLSAKSYYRKFGQQVILYVLGYERLVSLQIEPGASSQASLAVPTEQEAKQVNQSYRADLD